MAVFGESYESLWLKFLAKQSRRYVHIAVGTIDYTNTIRITLTNKNGGVYFFNHPASGYGVNGFLTSGSQWIRKLFREREILFRRFD